MTGAVARRQLPAVLLVQTLLGVLGTPGAASADPMRPLRGAAAAAAAGTNAPTAPVPAADGVAPPPPRLVAIRQDSARRWHALIGERWLTAGERLGDATVMAIDGNTVHLADKRAARGRRTLHLLQPLSPSPPSSPSPSSPPTPPTALLPDLRQPQEPRLNPSATP